MWKGKAMHNYEIEITDTFGGEANYSWVKRASLTMPELTHYGYDGSSNYVKANKVYRRELVKKAKALANWTGLRCSVEDWGNTLCIRPTGACMVAFVTFQD
jgi:hypothetical protein